jgi:beta-phosphoglucomutase-like phosphatase (HAD superfamily)
MNHSLTLTGLLPRLEGRLYSTQQVARGKPHPDIFLHAAAAMGHAPADCVVIEDTPVGATAARAAGMRCLAYVPEGESAGFVELNAEPFSAMAQLLGRLGLA